MSNPNDQFRLPSLMALKAFNSASKTCSFTMAAKELFLTQSAISRHVRNLEQDLNVQLFHRKGRELSLTSDGEALKEVVEGAFFQLSDGIRVIRQNNNDKRLSISLLPSLATKWLVPLLGEFASVAPDVDIHIQCSRSLCTFETDDVDIAIRYGMGTWPGCSAKLLMHETITPVCAPQWLDQLNKPLNLNHLKSLPLLQGDLPEQWESWLQQFDVSGVSQTNCSRYTDDNALIQAAIDGQGFILGRSRLVSRDIVEGRLIAPFANSTQSTYSYWIVAQARKQPRAISTQFVEFLLSKVE